MKHPLLALAERLWSIFGLIFMFCFVGFLIYDYAVNEPQAARMQPVLVQEFQQITPLPGATEVEHDTISKPGSVLVTASYRTDAPYAGVRAYYDTALTAQGWRFFQEQPVTVGYLQQHRAGVTAIYCRPQQEADLYDNGGAADFGWTYAFSISWGGDVTSCPRPQARWQAPVASALLGLFGLGLITFGLLLVFNGLGIADASDRVILKPRRPSWPWLRRTWPDRLPAEHPPHDRLIPPAREVRGLPLALGRLVRLFLVAFRQERQRYRPSAPSMYTNRLIGIPVALFGLMLLALAVFRSVPRLDTFAQSWLTALFAVCALSLFVAAVTDIILRPKRRG